MPLNRARSEFVEQLVSDIASYYGYNDFLAEKLFQLFPVAEACPLDYSTLHVYADDAVPGHRVFRRKRGFSSRYHSDKYPPHQTSRSGPGTDKSWCQFGANRQVDQRWAPSVREQRANW